MCPEQLAITIASVGVTVKADGNTDLIGLSKAAAAALCHVHQWGSPDAKDLERGTSCEAWVHKDTVPGILGAPSPAGRRSRCEWWHTTRSKTTRSSEPAG